MIRAGIIGVGKMGISHHAILGAHPRAEVRAICDSATYVTSALRKHTGVTTFKDYRAMIDSGELYAVVVATPTATHFDAASYALDRGLLATPWRLRDDVRLHQVAQRTDDGWYADAQVLQQERGLRWSGGVDAYGATLLAGCDGTRRLGDLLAVLASSAGLTEAEAAEQVLPVVERLVEQGFLVP